MSLNEFDIEPKGLMTSVQYSVTPAPFMLTPSVKRMGLAPSNNNNNRDSGAEPRMDLDENDDRLSAQVSQEHHFENLANS